MEGKPTPLLLCPLLVVLSRPALAAELEGRALQLEGEHLLVEAPTDGLRPGGTVAVYVEERRPDPRGGEVLGLRYAGDARLVWVSDGLVELSLAPGAQTPGEGRVLLGEARGLPPTPAWSPPPPPVIAAPTPIIAEAPPPVERAHRPPHRDGPESALVASAGWAGDGYDTGAGTAALSWRYRPIRGPGQVSIGLEGLRGSHWVQGTETDEPWATEAVAGV